MVLNHYQMGLFMKILLFKGGKIERDLNWRHATCRVHVLLPRPDSSVIQSVFEEVRKFQLSFPFLCIDSRIIFPINDKY